MKKIINNPEDLVLEMCNGIVLAHTEIELIKKYKILKKKNINNDKVTLLSGGGSGHEPAHAGFIGNGMLDVAVCGDVFASPSQIQVYKAILESKSDKGTLLIIKNYSGDMMNFKNAASLAIEDGLNVEYVKVDDDIAVEDSLFTVGRRGVAGTVLVHKVAGSAAEMGLSLKEVKEVAENAIKNTKTIGFALSSCVIPAKGTNIFEIEDDEMEYGVGIHGEPGISREKSLSSKEIASKMVKQLIEEQKLVAGDEITVLVNGFGSTPLQELYLLNNDVSRLLSQKNIKIYRVFVGNYMTSIDMLGASISFMKMNDSLKKHIDNKCDTPAFRVSGVSQTVSFDEVIENETVKGCYDFKTDSTYAVVENNEISYNNMVFIVDKMTECIIKNEVPFCELDSHAGDGDFGMSIAKGFKKLKDEWEEILQNSKTIGEFLEMCSIVIMEHCGGASGPIWGSAFRSAGKYSKNLYTLNVMQFAEMLENTILGIQKTGENSFGRGAEVGDKTLVDALIPCRESWFSSIENNADIIVAMKQGAKAAVEGAEYTKEISARMGRAGTVGDRSIGYPDAGAFALGVIFTEISESLK